MKKWKYVRRVLSKIDYNTSETLKKVFVNKIDSDAYLHCTDQGGNKFKARFDSNQPILTDSDTIIITVEPLINMSFGETQQIIVKNEDNIIVNNECQFIVPDEFKDVITVNENGLISAIGYGEDVYVEIVHEDFDINNNPGASGTTSIFNIYGQTV